MCYGYHTGTSNFVEHQSFGTFSMKLNYAAASTSTNSTQNITDNSSLNFTQGNISYTIVGADYG